jgi:hypothetical protein
MSHDGVVDVFDLLILLAERGPCPQNDPCWADLDGSGTVDTFDLLILLGNWGNCPGYRGDREVEEPPSFLYESYLEEM